HHQGRIAREDLARLSVHVRIAPRRIEEDAGVADALEDERDLRVRAASRAGVELAADELHGRLDQLDGVGGPGARRRRAEPDGADDSARGRPDGAPGDLAAGDDLPSPLDE